MGNGRNGARKSVAFLNMFLLVADVPSTSKWPGGLKSAIERIHRRGLKAGIHTLSANIQKDDAYVTPVPDKRLAKLAQLTLAQAVDSRQPWLPTLENTSALPRRTPPLLRPTPSRAREDLLHASPPRQAGPSPPAKRICGVRVRARGRGLGCARVATGHTARCAPTWVRTCRYARARTVSRA